MIRQTQPAMPAQFDMFSDDQPEGVAEFSAPELSSKRPAGRLLTEADMVERLVKTGRYRILQKLEPRQAASCPRPGFPFKGLILDTETTGLNHRKDEIIEIGMVAFSYDESGAIGDVTGIYGGLRQPGLSIPAEITRLTGITDEMVAGQTIDMDAVYSLVAPADLVIAHNARFDRPFCEAFSAMFEDKAWACSNAEIDWAARGFEGTKLGYLIGQAGFFHDGHRAVDDCFALLEVLDRNGQEPVSSPFAELYRASQKSRVRIFAEHSPFDMKDHLKARGYRWSDGSEGRPKSWWIEVDEANLDSEIAYLRSDIYGYAEADPPKRHLTAFDRFRA
jgi:DNA polymerase-3 subunit epsilon